MKCFVSFVVFLFLAVFSVTSCRTTHFDRAADSGPAAGGEAKNYREELAAAAAEERQITVEEELKEVDIERTVIYVDRPIYSPVEEPEGAAAGFGLRNGNTISKKT